MNRLAEILDCTLRDGGYCNDWNFGKQNIFQIINALSQAQINNIELGILSNSIKESYGRTVFTNIYEPLKYLQNNNHMIPFFLMNYGDYYLHDFIQLPTETSISIRIAFHKLDWKFALDLCYGIKEKGYRVYPQPMATNLYSEKEILNMLSKFNQLHPDGMYIVDSFGSMSTEDTNKLYRIYNSQLSDDIVVGFHPHNNIMLALANSLSFINQKDNRKKMLDATIGGIGRGAGNLCLETIMPYLDYDNYSLLSVFGIIDKVIKPIYNQHPWGYSIPYYISGLKCCHPNYAKYLITNPALSYTDMYNIICRIPKEKREVYDEEFIKKICKSHLASQTN